MLGSMTINFDRVRYMAIDVVKDQKIIDDHNAICEAIAAHDVAKAKEAMMVHLNRGKVDEDAIRSAYPHYIKGASRI